LAPLSNPELVPVAVATALGLELASDTASPLSIANALRSRKPTRWHSTPRDISNSRVTTFLGPDSARDSKIS
jgi:hypothetical protein